jgi:hypothetical protein
LGDHIAVSCIRPIGTDGIGEAVIVDLRNDVRAWTYRGFGCHRKRSSGAAATRTALACPITGATIRPSATYVATDGVVPFVINATKGESTAWKRKDFRCFAKHGDLSDGKLSLKHARATAGAGANLAIDRDLVRPHKAIRHCQGKGRQKAADLTPEINAINSAAFINRAITIIIGRVPAQLRRDGFIGEAPAHRFWR